MHSFSKKMLLICMVLVVLPMVFMSVFQYRYTSQLIKKQSDQYLQDAADWTEVKVQDFIREVEDITYGIVSNSYIQKDLQQLQKKQDYFENYQTIESLKERLSEYELLRPYIMDLVIRTPNEKYYSCNGTDLNGQIQDRGRIYRANGKLVWQTEVNQEGEILAMRKINSLKATDFLGYLTIVVSESNLNDLISSFSKKSNGSVYLTDQENRIISSEDKKLLGTTLKKATDHSVYYESARLENGWQITVAAPVSYFRDNVKVMRRLFYLMDILTAVILSVIAGQVFGQMTGPLVQLTGTMKQFGQGDFNVRSQIESKDEIGTLSDTFNRMADQIQELLDEVYEQQILRQKAQMQSLQMQINPHFLYNTLDTMNWMARMRGVEEVGDIAYALGNLMRFALKADDIIPLARELQAVEYYIQIQEYRYGDRLRAEINIPEELYRFEVPKLLIQPILENAIVHGIEDKMEDARIWVRGRLENGQLCLTISDNGCGIPQEKIAEILSEEEQAENVKRGIGLRNVQKRLVLRYGESCGIHIRSQVGRGTEVELRLTAVLYDPV